MGKRRKRKPLKITFRKGDVGSETNSQNQGYMQSKGRQQAQAQSRAAAVPVALLQGERALAVLGSLVSAWHQCAPPSQPCLSGHPKLSCSLGSEVHSSALWLLGISVGGCLGLVFATTGEPLRLVVSWKFRGRAFLCNCLPRQGKLFNLGQSLEPLSN